MSEEFVFAGSDQNDRFTGGLLNILNRDDINDDDDALSLGSRLMGFLKELLGSIDLPSKEVFMTGVEALVDRVFKAIDFPGPDPVIEPILKALILASARQLYDQFAAE